MTDTKEILQKYAEKLGYPYIKHVCDKPELQDYYVCYNEMMKRNPHGKFGQPCIIALDHTAQKPYRLSRGQVTALCRKMQEE